MDNNDILKKLRVALQYRDDDIQRIIKLGGMEVSKSELGAIFRKPDHPKYKVCGDQILRNFLNGLITEKRGPMEKKNVTEKPTKRPDFKSNKPSRNRPPHKRTNKK